MKHKLKQLTALMLALVMCLGLLPTVTLATEIETVEEPEIEILDGSSEEPETAEEEYEEETAAESAVSPLTQSESLDAQTLTSTEENIAAAAEYIRTQMSLRESTISGSFVIADMTLSEVYEELSSRVFEYTSNGKEGDYLKNSCAGWSWSYGSSTDSGVTTFSYELQVTYRTTAEQEEELSNKIDEVIEELSLNGLTEYEKVKKIYDYIVTNVAYDYVHVNDSSYMLAHTAYAALIDGTAVCEGYSALFYLMAHEAGLSARIITGMAEGERHAWNIVKIGDVYYYVDTTFASTSGNSEEYFLKGNFNFSDHVSDSDYLETDFVTDFPVSDFDYEEDDEMVVVTGGDLTSDIQWSIMSSVDDSGAVTYYLEIQGITKERTEGG